MVHCELSYFSLNLHARLTIQSTQKLHAKPAHERTNLQDRSFGGKFQSQFSSRFKNNVSVAESQSLNTFRKLQPKLFRPWMQHDIRFLNLRNLRRCSIEHGKCGTVIKQAVNPAVLSAMKGKPMMWVLVFKFERKEGSSASSAALEHESRALTQPAHESSAENSLVQSMETLNKRKAYWNETREQNWNEATYRFLVKREEIVIKVVRMVGKQTQLLVVFFVSDACRWQLTELQVVLC